MNILITGTGGFIGSNVTWHLANFTDHKLICLDSFKFGMKSNAERLKLALKDIPNSRYTVMEWDLTHDFSQPFVNQLLQHDVDIILNIASDSHVTRSISNPAACWFNNCALIYNMLELSRKLKPKAFVQISCYDEQTRVMTPAGFKTYDEVKIGDTILTLNPATGLLEDKKILDVIVQDYAGEMYHFNRGRTDLMVTPNHRMLYQDQKGIHSDSAENLMTQSYARKFPKASWKGIKEEKTLIPGFGEVDTHDLFYLCGLYIGDWFTNRQTKKVKNKTGLKRAEYLKLCRDTKGKFVFNGKIGTEETTECVSHRIWLDIPFNDSAFPKACAVLDRLGLDYTTPKNKSGEHIYFTSAAWLDWFKQFGTYAENKHIPDWMLQYDRSYLEKLFEGLIDSDGRAASTNTYTTCSPSLVRDLCELGIKLGYFPIFREKHANAFYRKENRVIQGTGYYVHFCTTHPNFSKGNLSKQPYNGKIWCLKVEDNKNLIVERNGRIAISGNTDEVYGDAGWDGPGHPEWDAIVPSNPYSASKAAQEALAISYFRTYNVPLVLTNTMNVIGKWQDPEKFLPKMIKRILNGEVITLHADNIDTEPKVATRVWLDVHNMACALSFIIHNLAKLDFNQRQKPPRFHLVGDVELSVLELTRIVANMLNKTPKYELVQGDKERPGYDRRYALVDNNLKAMGYNHPIPLQMTLNHIVDWVIANPNWVYE